MGRKAQYFTSGDRKTAQREFKQQRDSTERGRACRKAQKQKAKSREAYYTIARKSPNAAEVVTRPEELPVTLVNLAFCHVDTYTQNDLRTLEGRLCAELRAEGQLRVSHCQEGHVATVYHMGVRHLAQLIHEWERVQGEENSYLFTGIEEDSIHVEWLARRIYCLWDDLDLMESVDDFLSLYSFALLSWQSLTNMHLMLRDI
ncbi:hypothetical protein CERSUDRAFT_72259 [Gelatoporia subvermispora B]|uniref:Uncharacterized protein n=1 Tax=Ceriporiopsis subvermispora (strain B) TaxID=914234 RepID=M2PR23_CERS8|nr:hypothetical protein CERSUDRAFT_72259 [Gelatoporia subvermispora B]